MDHLLPRDSETLRSTDPQIARSVTPPVLWHIASETASLSIRLQGWVSSVDGNGEHIAHHEDASKTSLQLDDRDTDVPFSHCRDLVRRKVSEGVWGIGLRRGACGIRLRALA